MDFKMFNIFFIVIVTIAALIFLVAILSIISPRFQGWMMARRIKAVRHAVEDSQSDLKKIGTTVGNVGIDVNKELLNERGEDIKDIAKEAGTIVGETIRAGVDAFGEDKE